MFFPIDRRGGAGLLAEDGAEGGGAGEAAFQGDLFDRLLSGNQADLGLLDTAGNQVLMRRLLQVFTKHAVQMRGGPAAGTGDLLKREGFAYMLVDEFEGLVQRGGEICRALFPLAQLGLKKKTFAEITQQDL